MLTTVLLCAALGQTLSPPPLIPLDDAPPPPPPPSLVQAPRTARLIPAARPVPGALVIRAVLSPLIALGIGLLTTPVGMYVGILAGGLFDSGSRSAAGATAGAGVGLLIGAAAGFLLGTTLAATLFDTERGIFKRALPWGIGATVLAVAAMCLVLFVPAIGLAALPWVVVGATGLAVAVPLVVEATRPEPGGVTVASF